MSTSTHLITYEESLSMPESNIEEVIDGELFTMPPASKHHNAVLGLLHRIFIRHMRDSFDVTQGTGFLIRREPLLYRIPDLAIVDRTEWRNDLRLTSGPYSNVVPELVIEIVSPANRKGDVERLIGNYAQFGIPEVLLFHPEFRTCQSYRGPTLSWTAGTGIVSPQTIPEIDIDLGQLWAEFQITS